MNRWTGERGFTLMELMIVVAILAVLSVVAVTSYKKYMRRAATQEAIALVSDIKIKQAQFKAAYGQYVSTDSSPTGVFDDGGYYPLMPTPGEPAPWTVNPCSMAGPDTPYGRFCQLGVRATGDVFYQYKTIGWNPNNPQFNGNPPANEIPNATWVNRGSEAWWYASARARYGRGGWAERVQTYVMDSVLLTQPMVWETSDNSFPTAN